MKLIDKSTLVAELNRLIAELVEEGENTMFEQGRISAFEDVKVFINHTLEVKEVDLGEDEPVSNDLEKAAVLYNKKINFVVGGEVPNQDFIAGAQWQKEQMIKDAYTGIYDCCDDTSWIEFKGWLLSTSEVGEKIKLVIIKEE